MKSLNIQSIKLLPSISTSGDDDQTPKYRKEKIKDSLKIVWDNDGTGLLAKVTKTITLTSRQQSFLVQAPNIHKCTL